MSFSYNYYQPPSQHASGSQETPFQHGYAQPSPLPPSIAMLTQNSFPASPFVPPLSPAPFPAIRTPVEPDAPVPRPRDPSPAEAPPPGPAKRPRVTKGKSRAVDTESQEPTATSKKKAIASWTRVKVRGKSDEQFMLDICCKPEFWNKWRGGDKNSRKSETIKWINGLRSDFGFPEPRNEKSITAKIQSIEKSFRDAVVWKGRTGQGLKDDDLVLGGGSVREYILSMCPRFYDLWDVLSRRMGTVPQSLWSTGDENDDILDLMLDLAARQGGDDGDEDADGDTEGDSDGGLSVASVRRREALREERGEGVPVTPMRGVSAQPSQAALMGEFPAVPPSQAPLSFPGRQDPPSTPATSSNSSERRPRSVRKPQEGSGRKDTIIGTFLAGQSERIEIDKARLQLEQEKLREERERAERERERAERDREDQRAREEKARQDRLADRAAWDTAWDRESARGVDLGTFVQAYGPKPL